MTLKVTKTPMATKIRTKPITKTRIKTTRTKKVTRTRETTREK